MVRADGGGPTPTDDERGGADRAASPLSSAPPGDTAGTTTGGGSGRRGGDRTGSSLTAGSSASPLPFTDLRAPAPITAAPPPTARWLAFSSILLGGLFGGMIGYGTADLLAGGGLWAPTGGLIGALIGSIGVGVVATLTLRAMNEWRAVHHPEAATAADTTDTGTTATGTGTTAADTTGASTGTTAADTTAASTGTTADTGTTATGTTGSSDGVAGGTDEADGAGR